MYKAIIVEDDPMVTSIHRQYMAKNKEIIVVGEFRNGRDALEFLKTNGVDLAIVDYYMPVMNGLDFVKQCRKMDLHVSIIMITAANTTQDISTFLKLGVLDYLVKPFTYERFQKSLEKYFFIKRAFIQDKALDQEEIDRLLARVVMPQEAGPLEKGLQEQTLELIRVCLKEHNGIFMSSNEIAKEVGLSRITVRRYMNYLVENSEIISQVDYSTGGRPSIKYRSHD